MGPQGRSSFAQYATQRRSYKSNAKVFKRIATSFKPYKWKILVVLIAIIVITVLGLINPLMIRYVFDDAIGKHNTNLLITLVSIMIVTPIVTGIIGVWQSYLNNQIGQSVMRDFRNGLYSHLQQMSIRFFTATKTGEMQSRLSNDVGGIQGVITDTATSVVSNISTILSTIIAMLFLSPILTVVSLGLLPLFLWITYKVGNIRRVNSSSTQESIASLTALMQETLSISGILLIKTFGRQQHAQARFEEENQKLTNLQIRQQMIGRWFFMFMGTFFSIIPAIVYLVAGLQIIHDPLHAAISLGGIVAFTTLQSRLFFPVGQLLNTQVEIQGALALFERIFEYMDMDIEIQDGLNAIALDSHQVKGKVAFEHVYFSYKPDEQEGQKNALINNERAHTLSDISFTIQPGQLAALVGPSGAGKTTITYLIPRLYDVDSGEVKIDDYNIKDIQLQSLGELIGVVTQETYLFHSSVRENLLFVKPDASFDELVAATKAALIHERIMELPEGYDTVVGERGYKLSGGEKQRLAIARVILKNPKILILDEATSALDTRSERLIQQALEPLMKKRTTIAIAHRLSTILAADIIVVVDKGTIIEQGTHEELLQKGGVYSVLYKEQFLHEQVKAYVQSEEYKNNG